MITKTLIKLIEKYIYARDNKKDYLGEFYLIMFEIIKRILLIKIELIKRMNNQAHKKIYDLLHK